MVAFSDLVMRDTEEDSNHPFGAENTVDGWDFFPDCGFMSQAIQEMIRNNNYLYFGTMNLSCDGVMVDFLHIIRLQPVQQNIGV